MGLYLLGSRAPCEGVAVVGYKTPVAWQINEYGEGHSVIMFSKSNAQARAWGANELNTEFEDVECFRAPKFDDLIGKHISQQDYIERGFWYECADTGCCRRVCQDSDNLGGYVNGEVYCTDCYTKIKDTN